MNKSLIIYGATGYTGRLVCAEARQAGLDFIVAGREAGKVRELAETLDVPCRVFSVDDRAGLHAGLKGCATVLNCAGPFARTAPGIMAACIAMGIHYLDITAEFGIYAFAESLSESAKAAGVMLLPGVGWDVVPSDCLAACLAARVERPRRLRFALQVAGSMSRGSAASAAEIMSVGLLARRDGRIVAVPDAKPAGFDFGEGPVECVPFSFGDLVTAWHSTGAPDIEMFVHVTGAAFPTGDLSKLPDGPSAEERSANRARVAAEVTGADGSVARAIIDTVNGYSYTPLSAVQAAARVLAGEHKAGFQTPATVFGWTFATTLADTQIIDL
ncbi:membrane protein [Opitutaceae bacterium TAV5]|nr:membrane protein [Opitutaceae bacterium TAV5]